MRTNQIVRWLLVVGLLASSCSRQQSSPEASGQQSSREAEVPGTLQEPDPISSASTPKVEMDASNFLEEETAAEDPSAADRESAALHRDHNPRYGGTFFMALSGTTHLEGVLVTPGTFRVYVYDAYTRPLTHRKLEEVQGHVRWGESEDAPKLPLRFSEDEQALEAELGRLAQFPVTLTLYLRLPGSPPGSRPKLFIWLLL